MKLKKVYIKILLLTITLTGSINSNCVEGCLKCNSDNKCMICDTTNNYLLISQSCEKADQPNCLQINLKGQCLSCTPNHYLDENTLKCIQIEEASKIENCLHYLNSQNCLNCEKNFFLTLKCEKVVKEIEGCEIYKNGTHCSVCEKGRFLSYNSSACETINPIPNCNGYSSIKCNECENGSILNFNNYIYNLNSNVNIGDTTLLTFYDQYNIKQSYFSDICKSIDVLNCENYISFEECKICAFGYYLQKGKCIQYPSEIIPECEDYESFVTCLKCKENYHISNSKKCVQNEKIEHCMEYDPKATQTMCKLCEDDFFLLSNTNCKVRSITEIENCEKLSKTQEKCEKCSSSFVQTDDGLACLPELLNCIEYENSTKSDTILKCKNCDKNYYKNLEDICTSGNILNCEIYNNDESCSKCRNKFFLENLLCSSHSEIISCNLYHLTEKDKCFQCDLESLNFVVENICKETEKIEGCEVYSDATTCFKCKEGYYLNLVNCIKIQENLNCLIYDNNELAPKCLKCDNNHILQDGKCTLVLNAISENCVKVNLDNGITDLQTAKCEYCKENSVFYDTEDYVCTEKLWLTKLTTSFIDNCEKFVEDAGTTKCLKCKFGHFLVSDTECGTCEEAVILLSLSLNTTYKFSDKSFECLAFTGQSVENCKKYISPNKDSGTSYAPRCLECDKPYKIIDPSSIISLPIMEYNPLVNNGYPTNPVSYFPAVSSCKTITNENIFPGEGPVENCDYYKIYDSTKIGCIKCKHGFTGTLKVEGSGAYINKCESFSCGKTFVPGLPVKLNSYISCHTCSSGKLPVLFAAAGTSAYTQISGLKRYKLDSQTNDWDNVDQVITGKSMNCYSKTELSSLSTISPINLPDNCSILLMNIESTNANAESANLTTNVNTSKLAVMCLACEKGYRRKIGKLSNGEDVPFMVGKCEVIENCGSSNWMNYCSNCKDGFSHKFTTDGVDYGYCVPVIDINCYASDDAKVCKICKKGSKLNLDGVCENIISPKCVLSSNIFKFNTAGFINTYFYLSSEGKGCVQCEESYYALSKNGQNFNDKICMHSEYAKKQIFDPNQNNYIKNCKNYYLEGASMLCKYCLEGSVVSQNGAFCYPINSLLYCKLAASSSSCSQCIKTHISVSGICKKKEISNCKDYVLDSQLSQQKCQLCDPSFYIKDFFCEKANVNNCEEFGNDPNICISCFNGFEKVSDSEGNNYCFPHDPALNCETFDKNKFEQQILNCSKCKSDNNYYISTQNEDFKNSICSKFTDVPNCKIKKVGNSFETSTFRCEECEDGYYSYNGNCTLRTNLHSNCNLYIKNQDLCQNCQSENFLSESKKECHPYPNGIIGCRVYTSSTKCVGCLENYYLSGDNCILVKDDSLIKDCIFYSDATSCKQCKENFFLEGNTCLQVKALNCKTSISVNKCGSCYSDRGLKEEGDKINCVKPKDNNCKSFSTKFPFECYDCKKGYYVGPEKLCINVESSIDNCITYATKDTCKKCKKNYLLSINKDQCSNYSYLPLDKKCEDSVEIAQKKCTVCSGGFFMSDSGECVACGDVNCYFCDPLDKSKCLLCQAGSFMDKEGGCTKIAVEVVVKEEDSGVGFINVLGVFVALMYLL